MSVLSRTTPRPRLAGGGPVTDRQGIARELRCRPAHEKHQIRADLNALRSGSPGQTLLALGRLAAAFPKSLQGILGSFRVSSPLVSNVLGHESLLKNLVAALDPKKPMSDRIGGFLRLTRDLPKVIEPGDTAEVLNSTGLLRPIESLRTRMGLVLRRAGIAEEVIETILHKPGLLLNAATTLDRGKSAPDRIAAALGFARGIAMLLPAERLPHILGRMLPGLKIAKELATFAGVYFNEKKSALEKAAAGIRFARAARESLGDEFPRLAHQLEQVGSTFGVLQGLLVLRDPSRGVHARTEAARQVWFDAKAAAEGGRCLPRLTGKQLEQAAAQFRSAARLLGADDTRRPGSILLPVDGASAWNRTDRRRALDSLRALLPRSPLSPARQGRNLIRSLLRVVPAIGAAPSVDETGRMLRIAAATGSAEIRVLAVLGAALNGADAACGVLEALGAGSVGLSANVGLSAATLGIDLLISELRKDENEAIRESRPFQVPRNLRAAIGAAAIACGPIGWGALVATFGTTGAADVLDDTARRAFQLARLPSSGGPEGRSDQPADDFRGRSGTR